MALTKWWITQLVCLGLMAAMVGGAGVQRTWVVGAPREGSRPVRDVATANSGSNAARMIELTIVSDITFRYARTSMLCVLVNDAATSKEITFNATLPAVAFVSAFHIDVGGHRHVGEVKTKDEANQMYGEAKTAGKTAAKVVMTARDSNMFTVSVNVERHEEVSFNLTYDELLVRRLGGYTHVVHIDPGQIVDDMRVSVRIEESNKLQTVAVIPLAPDVVFNPDEEYMYEPTPTIERPTPESAFIEWSPTPEEQRELKTDGVEGRFVVTYDVDRDTHPNQILIHDGYFVHFYAPNDLSPLDKHVVFVLDTSGSMAGTRISQLKEAMAKILSDLRPDDYFTIVEFNTEINAWKLSGDSTKLTLQSSVGSDLVVKATSGNIQTAKIFVNDLQANGGTNIYDSLMLALKIIDAGAEKFATLPKRLDPLVIFLTDGDPNLGEQTSPDKITAGVVGANTKMTSLFTLGFGPDINMAFLRDLSFKNGGFARLIYDGNDSALQLENFYTEVSLPLLKNLKFRYTNVDTTTLTRLAHNTLHSGTELIMAGKISSADPKRVRASVRAQSRYGRYSAGFAPPKTVDVGREDFMERLWAYLTIQQLIQDPKNVTSMYNAQEMALEYSFVTPLTSLVVVRPDVEDSSTAIIPEIVGEEEAESELPLTQSYNGINVRLNQVSPPGSFMPLPAANIPQQRLTSGGMSYVMPLLWDSSVFNSTHVTITTGRTRKTYNVMSNAPQTKFDSCRGVDGKWHKCQHLNICRLPTFSSDFEIYKSSYFCAIHGNFAGVCCPGNS